MAKRPTKGKQSADVKAARKEAGNISKGVKAAQKARKGKSQNFDLKSFRSHVAYLKKRGLVSAKVDARKQKATRYMKDLVNKFRDVIQGRAAVVDVGKRKKAREYKDAGFRAKFDRVVVPKKPGDTRISYNKKSGKIVEHREAYGKRVKTVIAPTPKDGTLPPLPKETKKKFYRYAVPFREGVGSRARISYMTFETEELLRAFMYEYEHRQVNPFKNWENYIEVHEITKKTGASKPMSDKPADKKAVNETPVQRDIIEVDGGKPAGGKSKISKLTKKRGFRGKAK